jgi:hypothetical protein
MPRAGATADMRSIWKQRRVSINLPFSPEARTADVAVDDAAAGAGATAVLVFDDEDVERSNSLPGGAASCKNTHNINA